MTTYLVTRHHGTKDLFLKDEGREWLRREGFFIDKVVDHLDITEIKARDIVIGNLPFYLAYAVCEKNARYINYSIDLSESDRGIEIPKEKLQDKNPRLEEYVVNKVYSSEMFAK